MRKLITLLLALLPIGLLCLIFGPMLYGLSGNLTSKNLYGYALVYQVGEQRYAFTPNASRFAVDRFGDDPHLYLNTGDFDGDYYTHCFAADLLALVYQDFKTIDQHDNSFFAGMISTNEQKYCVERKQYRNAGNYYTVTDFLNPAGQVVYQFDPTSDANPFIKNLPIHGRRSSAHFNLRTLSFSERYLDLTAFLASQGLKLRWTIDDDSKLVTLSFEKLTQ